MSKSQTPARTKRDPLWAELAKAAGIKRHDIDKHANQLVRERSEEEKKPKTKPRIPKKGEFFHPANAPSMDDMYDDLIEWQNLPEAQKGFGRLGYHSLKDVMLEIDTTLYNTWVKAVCIHRNLRSPGELSQSEYSDRYWVHPGEEDDNEGDEKAGAA